MRWMAWILCLAAAFFSISASAEFYRYVDKDGNIHFTDNLSLVPESQRKGLQSYTEFEKKDETKPDESVKKNPSSPESLKKPGLPSESVSCEALDETKKHLDLTGQELELDREYRSLVQERKALQEEQKKASKNAIKVLNKKIQALNKKVEDYKIRQREYNKNVELYNAKIQKRNAAAKDADDAPTATQP